MVGHIAMPTPDELVHLKIRWPKGTRVRLVSMADPQAPAPGTEGTVLCVDGTGSVHVAWDTGGSLAALYRIDVIEPA